MAISLSAGFPPERLVELYADMDRSLFQAARGTDTLMAVTQIAAVVVPGAEQASISEGRLGRFRTLASTGEMASSGDRIQYKLGTGPCVDAMLDDTLFRSGRVASDTRWPEFGSRAAAQAGVVSMMALRLFLEDDDRIAGLNLYSTRPDAFDESDEIIATVVATHCAVAVLAATARERVANLERALASNRHIGMAIGVLMATHKVAEAEAFTLLRIASQNANRKLADVAAEVIRTGVLELPPAGPRKRPPPT